MIRAIVALVGIGLAAVTLAGVGGARDTAGPVTVKGTVGPGFTIGLTRNGKKVTTLKAGMYRFVVTDRSAIHNFVLEKARGGGFEKAITGVSFVGTRAFTVKLGAGTWELYCKPHEATMQRKFAVTAATASGGAAPPPADDNGGQTTTGSDDDGYGYG